MAARLSDLDNLLPKLEAPKIPGLKLVDSGWCRNDGSVIINRGGRYIAYYTFEFEKED